MLGVITEVKTKGEWLYILEENELGVIVTDPLTGETKAILWKDVEGVK